MTQRLHIVIVDDNLDFAREALDKAVRRINDMRPGGDLVVSARRSNFTPSELKRLSDLAKSENVAVSVSRAS